jgi:hypothetical protein
MKSFMKSLSEDAAIWIGMAVVIIALGIVGEMDYQDACRADKHCQVEK